MTPNQKNKLNNSIIILLSALGLIAFIAVLFPQIRQVILDYVAEHVIHKETSINLVWNEFFFKFAMLGILSILFFDYCTLTNNGKEFAQKVKQDIKDCLSEIDFCSFLKPSLILSGVYFLGILTIIRANFLYRDDIWRAAEGSRLWTNWSRYISEFLSIFIHADTNLTDISPLPQLLTVIILSISSVLLVYIIGNKKITTVGLLASIPLGLSPYFLECLSYKFDSPYMALSMLVSIIPFLFIARKKAFLLVSVLSLLVMCMTYQASSGIYMMIVVILCFQYWNNKEKTNKEIISFLEIAAFAFCFAMLLFRFVFMRPLNVQFTEYNISTEMFPISHIISGMVDNIKEYAMTVNHDLGLIWKTGIVIVLLFFITKSVYSSAQRKRLSFFIAIMVITLSFILSFGVYLLLALPLFAPRALVGFGAFLAIMCIYIVSDYKKIAVVAVLALNWCFLVFAFSYGNALADQSRYAEFRITILLHDLSGLYPNASKEGNLSIQLKNSIEFTPTVRNIAKHYTLIEKLVTKRLEDGFAWDDCYYMEYFNYISYTMANWPVGNNIDFNYLDLPIVLDSYYHTIKSDGERVLIILKH